MHAPNTVLLLGVFYAFHSRLLRGRLVVAGLLLTAHVGARAGRLGLQTLPFDHSSKVGVAIRLIGFLGTGMGATPRFPSPLAPPEDTDRTPPGLAVPFLAAEISLGKKGLKPSWK
jgi:hypothetical protein